MGHFRQHLLGENLSDVQQEEGAGGENGEDIRHEMHGWFVAALSAQAAPWAILRGSPEARLKLAMQHIDVLFARSAWSPMRDAISA